MIRNAWYAAGFSKNFQEGDVQGHTIAGKPIVIWRTAAGEVCALEGRCAHKRFPLWEGRLVDGGALECAYHGFTYNADGVCVAIPALHDRSDRIPKTARQHKYPVVEHDGLVWVWPGDIEQSATVSPPGTPEIGSAQWETISFEPIHVNGSAVLLIENLFDLTHFYPLHATTIGTQGDATIPTDIEREIRDGIPILRTIRRRANFKFPQMTVDRFGVEVGDQLQIHEMVGPGLFHVVIKISPPGKLDTDEAGSVVMYHAITPVTDETFIWNRVLSCRQDARWVHNPDDKSLATAIAEGSPKVIEQDLWAVEEQQKMMSYPDEGYREVHIKTDGAVIMARQILDELTEAELRDASPDRRERVLVSERARSARDL